MLRAEQSDAERPGHKPVESLALEAIRKAGNPETLDLLDQRLRVLHGQPEDGAAGLGLNAHMFESIFTMMLDLETGMSIASAAEFVLASNAATKRILESGQWQREHARVGVSMTLEK